MAWNDRASGSHGNPQHLLLSLLCTLWALCWHQRLGRNSLGSGNKREAKRISWLAVWGVSILMGIFSFCLVWVEKPLLGIFTGEAPVLAKASKIFIVSVAFQIFAGIGAVIGGVLRGSGRQQLSAVYSFVAYYVLGLPFGAVLAFLAHLGVLGLWLGLLAALVFVSAFGCWILKRTNWDHQVLSAQERLKHLSDLQGSP